MIKYANTAQINEFQAGNTTVGVDRGDNSCLHLDSYQVRVESREEAEALANALMRGADELWPPAHKGVYRGAVLVPGEFIEKLED